MEDYRLENQLHKAGFAAWPAKDTCLFTALAQAFSQFQPVTSVELQQAVLGQLKGVSDDLQWASAEAQIRSQDLSPNLLSTVLLSLAVTTDTQVTLHTGDLQYSYHKEAAEQVHLAASHGSYFPVRPLSSDVELYAAAPACSSKSSCHTHCLICRRSGIKLIGSHILPNKMVRSTTGPESFSFNVATGTRGSSDILTNHGLCEECDGNLNTRGEDKAGKELHKCLESQAFSRSIFFYAMFSISWRILVRTLNCKLHVKLIH